jgi:DNA polymerase-1
LLGYRKHKKLLSTYIEKLPKEKDAFGHWRVHPTWNVIGARSGRWSAKGPNLMNMPKPSKVKLGSEVIQLPGMRDILMPDEGKFLVEFDASALELRIIALLAQDSKMIEDFDKDLHTINAAMLFNKQPKLWQDIPSSADDAAHVNAWGVLTYVTDKERDFAKRFVYGSNYGGSAKTIWKSMVVDFPHLSVRDIERALKMWAQARPLVAQWKSSQILKAAEAGYAEDIFSGRRCIFYDNFEPTKALNYPIQMLAIHILDMMMLKILPKLKDYDAELLMQVHDSLVFQTSKPFEFYEFLEENLYLELSLNDTVCPFPTDGKIGLDWGNMKKLKDAKALWQKAA